MVTPTVLETIVWATVVLAGITVAGVALRVFFARTIPEQALKRLEDLEAAWLRERLHFEGLIEEMEGIQEKTERKRSQVRAAQQRLEAKNGPPSEPQSREELLRRIREATGVYT